MYLVNCIDLNMFTVGVDMLKMVIEKAPIVVKNTAVGALFMDCDVATGTRCQHMRNRENSVNIVDLF